MPSVTYITGVGDAGGVIGAGAAFHAASDAAGDTVVEWFFRDRVNISTGILNILNGAVGDTFTYDIIAPATPVTPNPGGTGNCNIVGAPAVLIVPAAGNGAYDIDFGAVTPVPALDDQGNPNGYWDANDPDIGNQTVTPNGSANGAWNLYAVEIALSRYINKVPLLGNMKYDFMGTTDTSGIRSARVYSEWKHRVTLHNSGHVGLSACWYMTVERARTS